MSRIACATRFFAYAQLLWASAWALRSATLALWPTSTTTPPVAVASLPRSVDRPAVPRVGRVLSVRITVLAPPGVPLSVESLAKLLRVMPVHGPPATVRPSLYGVEEEAPLRPATRT